MAKIKIKNLSSLTESAALMRCAVFMGGNRHDALRNSAGERDVKIQQRQTTEGTYIFVVKDYQ